MIYDEDLDLHRRPLTSTRRELVSQGILRVSQTALNDEWACLGIIFGNQGIEQLASEKIFGVGKRKRDVSSIQRSR